MRRILVFIDWYKPGYKAGGPIRSMVNMVDHLADNYEFYIVTRNNDFLENETYPDLEPNKWIKTADNEFVYYFSASNLNITNFKNLIKSTAFDVAYINGIYSFYFSILPLLILKTIKGSNYIVAPRGMLSRQTFKAKVLKKRIGILFARLFRLYNNAIFHTTTPSESTDIQILKLKPKFFFQITNFPPALNKTNQASIEKKIGELKLVYTARISNEKNTLYALKCLQNYIFKGNITFDIYGSIYQMDYWNECLKVISSLPPNIKVNYLKDISNDKVFDVLQSNHFFFMPTLGENFGHSILESFISGRPVIISNTTPWQKLEEKGLGWDLELSAPESFAEAIQKALEMDNEPYQFLSQNCKKYASYYIENQNNKDEYCKMFG